MLILLRQCGSCRTLTVPNVARIAASRATGLISVQPPVSAMLCILVAFKVLAALGLVVVILKHGMIIQFSLQSEFSEPLASKNKNIQVTLCYVLLINAL